RPPSAHVLYTPLEATYDVLLSGRDPRRVRVLCIDPHRTSSGPEGSSDKVGRASAADQPEPFVGFCPFLLRDRAWHTRFSPASGGPRISRAWSVRKRSSPPFATRSRRGGSHRPTSSPTSAASARRPRPASSPRRST